MSNRLFRATSAGPFFAVTLLFTLNVDAYAEDAVAEAVKHGVASLDLRLRYENVSVDIPTPLMNEDEGSGLTLRTRLGYRTGSVAGLSGFVEFEDVRLVGGMNEFEPETPGYAVIADPPISELNQSFLHYVGDAALDGFEVRLGRQRIIYDNARFIGNVGWRQDEQTFDAVRLDYLRGAFSLSAAYVAAVEGITPAFDADTQHRLLNVTWKNAPFGIVTGYAYFLKPEHRTDGASFDTFGLRYAAGFPFEYLEVLGVLEYARQVADPLAGAGEYDTTYSLFELGADLSGTMLKVSQETLGTDESTFSFQTPLATKHAFNGWADKFLVTPDAGLVDHTLHLNTILGGVGVTVRWHEFSSDEGSLDFGSELDLQVIKKFGPYSLGVKYAAYDAEAYSVDTRKAWVWGEARF